jgi:ATP-dependent HslUV protease subunit HslV
VTTIAYRNGIIAADTGLVGNGLRDCFADKIVKRTDGSVAGASGTAWWMAAFLEWFRQADKPLSDLPVCETSTGIIVSRRTITVVESDAGKVRSFPIRAKYYAIGSGCRLALGAMFAGAHPIDAVRAAMAFDDSTHGRVVSLKVGK